VSGPVPGGTGAVPADLVPPPRRRQPRYSGRSLAIAGVSTIAFFTVVGLVLVNAPGWEQVRRSFFDVDIFLEALPEIIGRFGVNVQLFLIAEVLILVLGLVLAVMRSLPGPVLFPVRLLATVYVDLFRALPGILVIYVLGLGVPALRLPGVPNDPFLWGVIALTLLYSSYVSEVYRAGIESIHPSQAAAARSLGLTQAQALRHVVLPQAVRRVIPPLLNDFIGLQKDTVLVSFIGVVEIFRESQIHQFARFNFTPYLATALIFLLLTIPLARFTDWLVNRQRNPGRRPPTDGARGRRGRILGGRFMSGR
jgi:polar amino acid transport system permease protein